MKINADLTKRAEVHTPDMEWVPSPEPGVLRRMLDRDGGEVARSTTVVRFEPGAWFPEHTHGGGEGFLVLDGVFSNETAITRPAPTSATPSAPVIRPGVTRAPRSWSS